ncbi:hypothetical protein, partial [Streptomyces sp. NPDC020362]|uniref:hypothetical protein n=1 Tax=Streptomyces sp. NPDC020362 TaxID=3154486 RepID=UPI0033F5D7B3
DERAEGTTFRLPFFLFQGDSDVLTPPEPARRSKNRTAPSAWRRHSPTGDQWWKASDEAAGLRRRAC